MNLSSKEQDTGKAFNPIEITRRKEVSFERKNIEQIWNDDDGVGGTEQASERFPIRPNRKQMTNQRIANQGITNQRITTQQSTDQTRSLRKRFSNLDKQPRSRRADSKILSEDTKLARRLIPNGSVQKAVNPIALNAVHHSSMLSEKSLADQPMARRPVKQAYSKRFGGRKSRENSNIAFSINGMCYKFYISVL